MRKLLVLGALALLLGLPATSQADRPQPPANQRPEEGCLVVTGGNGIVSDQEAVYQAKAIIPKSARYRVVTGSGLRNPTSLTLAFVDSWYRYFLMPRRPDVGARWIICYGCDASKLGRPYAILWQDDDGISIGRLR